MIFKNVPTAINYGIELDLKKNIYKFIYISSNLCFLISEIQIDSIEYKLLKIYQPNISNKRKMIGQSPYIFNISIGYSNSNNPLSLNLNYNIFGERLSEIGSGSVPNIIELSRPLLDFNINYRLNKFNFGCNISNILNSPFIFIQRFNNKDYIVRKYENGTNFNFSFSYNF